MVSKNGSNQRWRSGIKVLHIAAGLAFGGVAEVVARLALHQQRQGCEVTMATVASEADTVSDSVHQAVAAGAQLVQFKASSPRAIYFSWQMVTGLSALVREAEVVHVHSNWTFPVWHGCWLALRYNKKLVMSPHGCLSPERRAHSKWKKMLAGIFDRYCLKRADVIHATCEAEAVAIKIFIATASGSQRLSRCCAAGSGAADNAGLDDEAYCNHRVVAITRLKEETRACRQKDAGEKVWLPGLGVLTSNLRPLGGLKKVVAMMRLKALCSRSETAAINLPGTQARPQVVVIPNGIELEEFDGEWDSEFWRKRFPAIGDRRVVLALGRLHPLKGLDLLVRAWAIMAARSTAIANWQLVIAGPDEQGTLAALKSLVEELGLGGSAGFAGPITAAERRDAIKAAGILALPSIHENFGLTVAEALACRVPVIASKGTPWAELRGSSASSKVNAPDGAGSIRSDAAGLMFKVGAADAAELSGAPHGSKGLDGDGYCDHKVVAIRRLKEQQAESSCYTAGEAIGSLKPSNQQRSCGLNQAVRPAQTSHEEAAQTSGDSRSGWWVDAGVEPLAEALEEAMGLSEEERKAMGRNGRTLVERRYQWKAVAGQMIEVYCNHKVVAMTRLKERCT